MQNINNNNDKTLINLRRKCGQKKIILFHETNSTQADLSFAQSRESCCYLCRRCNGSTRSLQKDVGWPSVVLPSSTSDGSCTCLGKIQHLRLHHSLILLLMMVVDLRKERRGSLLRLLLLLSLLDLLLLVHLLLLF